MEEIIVEIDENGDARIEGKGFVGEDCLITKVLEDALGPVAKRMMKPESKQTRTARRTQTRRG